MNLSPDEVLTTTRAVRKRLDYDRPVDPETDRAMFDDCPAGAERKQPTGLAVRGDRRSRRTRKSVGAVPRVLRGSSAQYLADTMHRAPYLLIPVAEGRAERLSRTEQQAAFWGSVTPALWSFMLAARARGLGTAWTTLHLVYEKEVADILGIPYERYTQIALTPIAQTIGTDFKPAAREPLESVTHWDHW